MDSHLKQFVLRPRDNMVTAFYFPLSPHILPNPIILFSAAPVLIPLPSPRSLPSPPQPYPSSPSPAPSPPLLLAPLPFHNAVQGAVPRRCPSTPPLPTEGLRRWRDVRVRHGADQAGRWGVQISPRGGGADPWQAGCASRSRSVRTASGQASFFCFAKMASLFNPTGL